MRQSRPRIRRKLSRIVADRAAFTTSARLLFHSCATRRERLPVIFVPSIASNRCPMGCLSLSGRCLAQYERNGTIRSHLPRNVRNGRANSARRGGACWGGGEAFPPPHIEVKLSRFQGRAQLPVTANLRPMGWSTRRLEGCAIDTGTGRAAVTNRAVGWMRLYREWVGRLKPTLRQVHTAGERVFVDFASHTMEVMDGATGEVRRAEIFVAVLGASSPTFAN